MTGCGKKFVESLYSKRLAWYTQIVNLSILMVKSGCEPTLYSYVYKQIG